MAIRGLQSVQTAPWIGNAPLPAWSIWMSESVYVAKDKIGFVAVDILFSVLFSVAGLEVHVGLFRSNYSKAPVKYHELSVSIKNGRKMHNLRGDAPSWDQSRG